MRALLGLVAASIAVTLGSPAAAVDPVQLAFSGNNGHGGFTGVSSNRRDNDRRRGRGDDVYIYTRDYQGDSAWRSTGFNDWWHDRPDRAYPHWMVSNQNCERQWYQGSILRC